MPTKSKKSRSRSKSRSKKITIRTGKYGGKFYMSKGRRVYLSASKSKKSRSRKSRSRSRSVRRRGVKRQLSAARISYAQNRTAGAQRCRTYPAQSPCEADPACRWNSKAQQCRLGLRGWIAPLAPDFTTPSSASSLSSSPSAFSAAIAAAAKRRQMPAPSAPRLSQLSTSSTGSFATPRTSLSTQQVFGADVMPFGWTPEQARQAWRGRSESE